MSNCRINIFEAGNVLSNKWVILELIGRGAMGEIYLAHQLNLKRDVAIKVVSEELLKDFDDDPEEIENSFQRFKREVHAMARVRHPNVLQIFDYGSAVVQREAGDCPVEFIVMEYIPGDTLRFTMSEEGFYPEQDLTKDWLEKYFLPVLDGIKAIHDLDIVHRDIKPENILMERFSFLNQSKWIWTAIVAAIVSMAAMTLWHLMGEPGKTPSFLKGPRLASEALLLPERSEFSTVKLKLPGTPGQTLLTEDGANLHFVPGGKITFPEGPGQPSERSVKVNPFFMDETRVTNHQYVEFLNRNLSNITVERGVVRDNDEIWLLMGEIFERYEPIIFRDGRFKINNAAFASYPVLRVTAYGASAYAGYYNKRLPSYTEWLYASGTDSIQQKQSSPGTDVAMDEMKDMHGMMASRGQGQLGTHDSIPATPMPQLLPDINFKPNTYGIRALNQSISEWGIRFLGATAKNKIRDAEYVILGGLGSLSDKKVSNPSPIIRHPWEAFEEVGFRCARSVEIEFKINN